MTFRTHGLRGIIFVLWALAAVFYTGSAMSADNTRPRVSAIAPVKASTKYEQYSSVAFAITFSEDINEATISKSSFSLAFGAYVREPTSYNRVSGRQYEINYNGSMLDNFRGPVEAFVHDANIEDLAGNKLNVSASPPVRVVLIDNQVPSLVSLEVPSQIGMNPFDVTIEVSEDSSVIDDTLLRVENGDRSPLVAVSGSDRRFTTRIQPDGNGPVSIQFEAGMFMDEAGNRSTFMASRSLHFDITKPTVTITTQGTSKNGAFQALITFSEDVDGFTQSDITSTNATLSGFSDGPRGYSVLVTPTVSEGTVTLEIAADSATDIGLNGNEASETVSVEVDQIKPTVTITGVPAATRTTPFTITVTGSELTVGLEDDDLVLTNATATGFNSSGSNDAPYIYTAVIAPDGNGDVSVSVPADVMSDRFGNLNTASAVRTAILDNNAPEFSITGVPAVTGTAPFSATFTISETAPGFTVDDIVLANAEATSFDDTNAPVYTAFITPDGTGDVSVSVAAGAVQDAVGNPNAASAVATAVLDTAAPSIMISGVPAVTGTAPFTASFTLSENVPGFTVDDLVLTKAAATSFDDTNAPVYTALITPDGTGDVSVSVAAGAVKDAAGNANAASAVATAVLDISAPAVWFNGVPGSTGPAGFVATIVVSEATTGFDISDLVLVNASPSGFDPANAPVFTVQITPNGNGDVSLLVPADSMVDTAGIGNAASGNVIVTLDTAPPAVSSITAEDSDPANGQLSWKLTFSEPVQGVGPANFTVEGVSGANMTVTPLGQRQGSLDPMTPAGFLRELFGVVSAHAAIPQATQYLVTVSGGNVATLTGSAVLVFGSAAGITDASGQGLVSVTPSGINQSTINPDTDAPSVAQIVAPAQVEGAFDANVIFSEPVNGFAATDLTVTNATVDGVTPQAPVGGFATVFTVRLTPLAHGPLTVAVVAGAAADAAGNQSTASGTLTISYLDTSYVQARTGAVIRNFLSQRATNILSNQPDLSGRLLDQGGFGATEQFAVSSNYGSGSLQLNFAGSLTRLMSGQAISDMAGEKTYGYGGPGTGEESEQGRTTRFNLWVKGNLAKSKLDGNEQGFGTFHIGADYRVTPDLMVGTLVQFDWADESNAAAATSASGTGWLAGPYAVYRLHENVVVDGYVAYGQSDNKVSPFGTYTDSFDTNRFLARGQITGDFDYAGWTIAPQLAASYLVETQEAYVDSNGVSIPEQDIEVGQLTFGPSFRKSHVLDNDVVLTPSLAVKGIWNFKSAGTANVTTGTLSGSAQDKLRARLELGVGAKFNDNFRLTSSGYVDGLGQDGYSGYGGTLGLNLRF